MTLLDRIHCWHRFWRYRLVTERESVQFLLRQNLTKTTAIDIGANKGAYTYWLSKAVGNNGQVISLEPQPELAPFLDQLVNTFRLKNVLVVNQAASESATEHHMSRKFAGHGGAKITKNEGDLKIGSVTLDELQATIQHRVSYIKCDVEGHEFEALKGARYILEKNQPIVQVEVHHQAAVDGQLFDFMDSLGYRGFFLFEGRKIPIGQLQLFTYPRSDNHRNYFFSKQNFREL
ncbi:MAG: hypothetical protein CMB80_32130 [Flammeovirgaceae bacterium]|nr:hypothetical protein [Flammeovirgaceae bacterium]MBE61653.1 hypothetical protein [Flammeovirgaceae bacterium]MBR07455.1 hypothetical protein [Rickettsiales bacterium]HCX20408.1 hypothetical protein [Cytophagales bacterium]|tara:strand:+ start:2210 stop:2908 length:699 start_codon:yes stop_codon:yes gene_type:complete